MEQRYRQEIDRLYLEMYPLLFSYARSSLANDALAEEAVQDTFLIACQKPEELLESPNPLGWLMMVLKYVISNTLRRQAAARRILADYVSVNAEGLLYAHDRLNLDVLYGKVAKTEEFQMLKEMALDGKSYLEMAEARHIHVDTCRKRVQRAREFLQKKLKK